MANNENDGYKTREQLEVEISRLTQRAAELEKELEELTRNRIDSQHRLTEERNRAQGYLDIAEVILVVLNARGEIELINRKGCRILGYEEQELIGQSWFLTCIPPDIRENVYAVFKRLMKGEVEAVEYYENPVITKDGEIRLIAWHNSVLKDDKRAISGILSSGEDITERAQMVQALEESEKKYRMLAVNSSDLIWTADINLRPTYISPSVEKLRGFTAKEALAQTIDEMLTLDSLKAVITAFKEQLDLEKKGNRDSTRAKILELEFKCKDGSTIWTESSISYLRNAQGGLTGFMGVTRDISERKEAEEKLRASLREKEILLKEVHHRVKNNMAIISSLLSLQAESIKDQTVLSAFRDSQYRIRSMALVHEKLYQAKDLSRIDFCDYIRGLVIQVSKSNEFKDRQIAVDIEADDIKMTIETAIPCGLITSELLTNAFKYAFPGDREGRVLIQLRRISGDFYKLVVSDNGIGLPTRIDIRDFSSFGLHLVHLLTQQLEGEIEVIRDNGTTFKIVFPV